MRAVLISVSTAPSRQCAADASPAVWDHTVLPATRYRRTRPCFIYGGRARPPHITAVIFQAVKAVPNCTAWWTEAHVCEQLAQGRYLAVPPSRSRTCNLSVTGSARYRYTTKPHALQLNDQ